MNQTELINTAIYAGIFTVLFGIGEVLYHFVRLPAEITRKFVHLGTGIICLTFPFFLRSHWSVLILTIAFFVILISSIKLNLLKSINAVDRPTRGSFMFPLVIYLTFWCYSIFGLHDLSASNLELRKVASQRELYYGGTVFYFLPILILSVSDPMAALCGKRWPIGKYHIRGCSKTIIGSGAFFLSAFILSLFFMLALAKTVSGAILIASIIAAITTIVEALSQRGMDNLFIPLSTVGVLVLFRDYLLI